MTDKATFKEAFKVTAGRVDPPTRAFASVKDEPCFIAEGEGVYIKDIEGERYIDFMQSWEPLLFGHHNKDIVRVCKKALKRAQVLEHRL